MKIILSLAAVFALLAYPETALNAAREAMSAWYYSVAPALFPFMALMPMLTSPQSARAYEFLLGPLLRRLLKLPGAAAPAIVVAMTAGSPAGAIAAARSGLSRRDQKRVVLCTCGLSPAFLVTGVGASMLGNPGDGHILLRAQLFSQLVMLLCTRGRSEEPSRTPVQQEVPGTDTIRAAVSAVLSVCGYMVVFSTSAAILARILRSETAGLVALTLLDLPSGARALAGLSIERAAKLLLVAAAAGFGGMCIAAQNLSACRNVGISFAKYLSARMSHACLMTAATAFQLRFEMGKAQIPLPIMEISALIAVILIVPALIFWKKNLFLNKRNLPKTLEFPLKNTEKPQDIVFDDVIQSQYVVK